MKKTKNKTAEVYTAMRLVKTYPDLQAVLEKIKGASIYEIDRTEPARNIETWVLFVYNYSIALGRELEHQRLSKNLVDNLLNSHRV